MRSFYWGGKLLSAVEARREIYATLYCREVVKTPEYRRLETLFRGGDLSIFDFDGYDFVELGMTPEDTIRDLDHSWGHGLLLALMLRGIDPRRLG